ncbi:frequenin-1-like protein [Leptotrombidium deliense]|uniref:Frequenin-1-like protein n=1 Tax=Leptotrombidium deliense TaxID=299467 RepID=A0A443SEU0_9ACAR|nr:frequenin-1-like protein [Leptotrombidium deliense]
MTSILDAIYQMIGNESEILKESDRRQRIDQIFHELDKNQDNKLSLDEFMQGSKGDPKIVQALSLYNLT